jgi:muconolactone delta-isomerase
MKILAIEKEVPGVTDDKFTNEILKAEAKKVWELNQAGIIRELYFHKDENYAVLILECTDKEEASKVIQSLPLVKGNLISFEIIPLVAYDGFARLFEKDI